MQLSKFIQASVDLFKTKKITLNLSEEGIKMKEAPEDDQKFIISELEEVGTLDPYMPHTYYLAPTTAQDLMDFLIETEHDYKLTRSRTSKAVTYTMKTTFLGTPYTLHSCKPEFQAVLKEYFATFDNMSKITLLDIVLNKDNFETIQEQIIALLQLDKLPDKKEAVLTTDLVHHIVPF